MPWAATCRLDRFQVDRHGRVTLGPAYDWLDADTTVAHFGYSVDLHDLGATNLPTVDRNPTIDGGG